MKAIDEILQKALQMGACNKSNGVTDWKTLVWLFFTPQGIEFCQKNNFPTLEMFREIKEEVEGFNVFVNAGVQKRSNDSCVALIGPKTKGELVFDDNTKVHKVIVMHGAKLDIVLRNYSVVRLINIGDNEIRRHRDKTSIILE
jgi:hypothetical protein